MEEVIELALVKKPKPIIWDEEAEDAAALKKKEDASSNLTAH